MFFGRILAAVATMTVSVAANADLVTRWDYASTMAFLPSTVVWTTGGTGSRSATSTQVQWGYESGGCADVASSTCDNSGLKIAPNTATGALDTLLPGDPTDPLDPSNRGLLETITHYNRVLQPLNGVWPSELSTIQLRTTLTLTPQLPSVGTSQGPLQVDFRIRFEETYNAPGDTSVTCPNGTQNGTGINIDYGADGVPGGTGDNSDLARCADIFVLIDTLNAASFVYEGYQYYVSIFETSGNLKPLSNSACSAAGASSGCIGFLTREDFATPARFAFLISSRPLTGVPAPGTIALLGLGLAAAGYFARRQRRTKH